MSTIQTRRANYQRHENVSTRREPIINRAQEDHINLAISNLMKMKQSTTAAAYNLRRSVVIDALRHF